MLDLLAAAPAANAPNWATILTALAAAAGLLAAYRAARYAVRQYELAVDRERRDQASKIAFWGEVDQDRMRIKYINTSGLPVWDVLISPAGPAGPTDRYRDFVLGPRPDPVQVGPEWQWMGGAIANMLESHEQTTTSLFSALGSIGDLSTITGGWKRTEAPTQKASVRLERARLAVEFTDASGVRWERNAAGKLRALNLPYEPTILDRLRGVGRWAADGLRSGTSTHDSSPRS